MTVAHQYSSLKNEKLQYRTQLNNKYTNLYTNTILQRSPIDVSKCGDKCLRWLCDIGIDMESQNFGDTGPHPLKWGVANPTSCRFCHSRSNDTEGELPGKWTLRVPPLRSLQDVGTDTVRSATCGFLLSGPW